jgi:hypothetical protein
MRDYLKTLPNGNREGTAFEEREMPQLRLSIAVTYRLVSPFVVWP